MDQRHHQLRSLWGPVVCGVVVLLMASASLVIQLTSATPSYPWLSAATLVAFGICLLLDGVIERTNRRELWLMCLPAGAMLVVGGVWNFIDPPPRFAGTLAWQTVVKSGICVILGVAYMIASISRRSFVFDH